MCPHIRLSTCTSGMLTHTHTHTHNTPYNHTNTHCIQTNRHADKHTNINNEDYTLDMGVVQFMLGEIKSNRLCNCLTTVLYQDSVNGGHPPPLLFSCIHNLHDTHTQHTYTHTHTHTHTNFIPPALSTMLACKAQRHTSPTISKAPLAKLLE